MYLRKWYRTIAGERKAYWALVESYRTERGPRQRVVAWVGQSDTAGRLGVQRAASGQSFAWQGQFFDEVQPEWVEVDAARVRVERSRDFGGPWLGVELLRRLGLSEFLEQVMPAGREDIPWPLMAWVLVLCRFCHPSSELHIAEQLYGQSGLEDLLGIPAEKLNEDRLYRSLDRLLPHKRALQQHLVERFTNLFGVEYDLLLYDVTSTYFEGLALANPLAQHGYSRDHRGDCKQVCIALVVSRGGLPLGYEVFAGNRSDVTTLEEMVTVMEAQYGRADRIWVVDRGMVSQANLEFLRAGERRYIVGTPRSQLKQFEQELVDGPWEAVREGLEVQRCPSPDGTEVFILCRSAARRRKEEAIHARFERRLEAGLEQLAASCQQRKQQPLRVARRVGRLLGRHSRAAGLFSVEVETDAHGGAQVVWKKNSAWREWATLREGCYLLRSNVADWSGAELWEAYTQLTQAEAAFRLHKQDLQLRPIWHQREDRVLAHILVCFLAYVLWKSLGQWCQRAGLGDEPRKVLEELQQIQLVDVVLPTKQGTELRKRCVVRPTAHQAILLEHLGLELPTHLKFNGM